MAYFPNGSAGDILQNQCSQCPMGEMPCPTALTSMLLNYDQCRDGQEKLKECMDMLIDEKGICQTFELLKQCKLAPANPVVPIPKHSACLDPTLKSETILPSMVEWARKHKVIA